MYLTEDERLLEYLAVENLYVDVVEGHLLEPALRQTIDDGGLKSLNLQMRGQT